MYRGYRKERIIFMNTAAFLIFYSLVWCMVFGLGVVLQRVVAGAAVKILRLPFTKLQIWGAMVAFTALEVIVLAMRAAGSY